MSTSAPECAPASGVHIYMEVDVHVDRHIEAFNMCHVIIFFDHTLTMSWQLNMAELSQPLGLQAAMSSYLR